ncbi:MAG: hypothetical protein HC778_05555 [Chamaesiphon sp. CSU_1_12]|nr:hypothetical protein [Chamaesiphon sp. CSU_1_12]
MLKDGENLRREIRERGFDGNLEQRVQEQINKVRESGSDPQKVREADSELTRLRQQNNRFPYYYYDPFYPYSTPGQIIFSPGYFIRRQCQRKIASPSVFSEYWLHSTVRLGWIH